MAKVIAVFDVNSNGCSVRLDDGRTIMLDHAAGHSAPSIGDEIGGLKQGQIPPTIAQLNSPEQVQANLLSQVVHDASGKQKATGGDGPTKP